MTYLKYSPQVVAGAGRTGHSRRYHLYGPLLAMLLCLPGLALADKAAEPQAAAAVAQVQLVNINTADAAALAAGLQGVGMSRAEDIIRYRETYGPFGAVEELVDVKGIGQATLDKNRAVITLE